MSAVHFNPRQLRRTAGVTLVVWLLALAAGALNACALTPTGQGQREGLHAHVAPQGPVPGTHASAGREGHHHGEGELLGHHGHEQDSGLKSCLKFCDDESSAVVKVKLPAADADSSHTIIGQPWNPIAATGGIGWRLPSRWPGSQGPPLVIRFLRLTL